MRIGIDLQVLGQREFTGVARYAYNLAKQLLLLGTNHQFVFFLPEDSKVRQEFQGRGAVVITLPDKKLPFVTAHWQYAHLMQRAKLDVLHGPANTLPLFYRGRSILTIHDLAIYRHPEWFPGGQWFSTKYLVPRSIKIADKIIVPSEATKRDLMELFNISSFKISVIPHGVDERFFRNQDVIAGEAKQSYKIATLPSEARDDKTKEYFLFVGTLEPRKNLVRLIQAYGNLPDDIIEKYDLVIAGAKGWQYAEIQNAKIKAQHINSKLKNKIKFIGYVSEDELPALMQNASLFVYPSLYEGFGLPVLEAMAAGVPVITSNSSSLPEVAGDAAVLVGPYSIAEMTNAITAIIRDSARLRQISIAGTVRAAKFNWEDTAQRTLAVYSAQQSAISDSNVAEMTHKLGFGPHRQF